MSTTKEQKQAATNTQEFVDYLIHLIETHDDRFSFVLAAGGETNTMKIYDKAKNIDYAVKIEPVKYNDDEDAVNPSDANYKTGKWENRGHLGDYAHAECSECGFVVENYKAVKIGNSSTDYTDTEYHFCPKCGAKMNI